MNYEELKNIVEAMKKDGKKSELIKLPLHYYSELGEYMREMEAELNSTDPDAPDYHILEDEFKSSKKYVHKIFESRLPKITELATLSALNSKTNVSAIANEEYAIFSDIKNVVERAKNELLLWNKAGDKTNLSPVKTRNKIPDSSKPTDKSSIVDTISNVATRSDKQASTSAMHHDGKTVEIKTRSESCKVRTWGEYMLVRAVADIDTFSGPDGREYSLKKDDVAPIPSAIAKILIRRHVAVQIFINKEVENA